MNRKLNYFAVCALVVGWVGASQAADPVIKCQQSKWKAYGKLGTCLGKNEAGLLAAKPDVAADCRAKFTESIQKATDKATAAMTSCRFVDNGDGTVSDLDLGLMWEKKTGTAGAVSQCPGGPACGSPHDMNNAYSWASGPSLHDGSVFTRFLAALNSGQSTDGQPTTAITGCLGGHCDWRLPTIGELQQIFDASSPGCLGPDNCLAAALGSETVGFYWSANSITDSPGGAWAAWSGNSSPSPAGNAKTDHWHAIAVRDGL